MAKTYKKTTSQVVNKNRYVIVFDYETDHLDTNLANPVQIGAVAIDLRNLEIDANSEFNVIVCPDDIDKDDYLERHSSTIAFHAKLNSCSNDEVMDNWKKNGISERVAWNEFINYCKDYQIGSSYKNIPIAAGQNIRKFDLPITENLVSKYNTRYPFARREVFDLLDMTPLWFMFSKSPPPNLKLETVGKYFGLDVTGAHDALFDVKLTAQLIVKFLKLYQNVTAKVPALNGAMK
jgi:DNA polymerase III epsilon subunit-like protein